MQLQSRDTLDSMVYLRIKEMIVNKQLRAGELIVQNQLSHTLGVSRTPLRKALGELEKEGLLEASPKGWYVKEFSVEDLISVFRIRAVLEGLACRLAADKLETPELTYMQSMFEHAYAQLNDKGAEAYYNADIKFHRMIAEGAKDSILLQTIVSNQIIYTTQMPGLFRDPHETYSEHMEIIKSLREKDGESAGKLMHAHIEKAIESLAGDKYEVFK